MNDRISEYNSSHDRSSLNSCTHELTFEKKTWNKYITIISDSEVALTCAERNVKHKHQKSYPICESGSAKSYDIIQFLIKIILYEKSNSIYKTKH